jgi:hypothetical protein
MDTPGTGIETFKLGLKTVPAVFETGVQVKIEPVQLEAIWKMIYGATAP